MTAPLGVGAIPLPATASASPPRLPTIIDVTPTGDDMFVGYSPRRGRRHIFGGQLVAQALSAASRTVELPVHSLHSYFLRGGDTDTEVVFDVHRTRDSRSFATRRVTGYQYDQPIFELSASFTADREGVAHADPAPLDVPLPETVPPLVERLAAWGVTDVMSLPFSPLDFRPVSVVSPLAPVRHPPTQQVWFRAPRRLPDDPAVHAGVLAYASDLYLLATSLRPHGLATGDPTVTFASLDHSLWLHGAFRADDWLLHEQHSSWASNGRALSLGKIFTQEGTLVASTAQEGIVRTPARQPAAPQSHEPQSHEPRSHEPRPHQPRSEAGS